MHSNDFKVGAKLIFISSLWLRSVIYNILIDQIPYLKFELKRSIKPNEGDYFFTLNWSLGKLFLLGEQFLNGQEFHLINENKIDPYLSKEFSPFSGLFAEKHSVSLIFVKLSELNPKAGI